VVRTGDEGLLMSEVGLKRQFTKRKLVRVLRRLIRTAYLRVNHPRRVTCLDCGFLSLGEAEVTHADRVMLHMKGTGGWCPSLDVLGCSRSLWVNYDLTYSGTSAEVIFDELDLDRRSCDGFFKYKPGWTPTDHRELLSKHQESRQKIVSGILLAVASSILTVLVAWVIKSMK
jgi:hypothetical protein